MATRLDVLFERAVGKTIEKQDVLEAHREKGGYVRWAIAAEPVTRWQRTVARVTYWWHVYWRSPFFLALYFVCALLSTALVWSEVSFFMIKPDLSIPSLLVNDTRLPSTALVTVILVGLVYIAVCAFYSLFRFRIFTYYRLLPHNQTDAASLMFASSYLCRLAAPMCYNYLFMIHNNSTAFFQVMGQMNVVPLFGQNFNVYFPGMVLVVCMFTLFNIYSHILGAMHITRFSFSSSFQHKQIFMGENIVRAARDKIFLLGSSFDGTEQSGGAAGAVGGIGGGGAGGMRPASVASDSSSSSSADERVMGQGARRLVRLNQ